MSLISRCPACATLFSVVPDQLKISEGWVRCGKCAQVFDASENLIEGVAAPQSHEGAVAASEAIALHNGAAAATSAPSSSQGLPAGHSALPEVDSLGFADPDSVSFGKSASELTDEEAQLLEELQAFKNAQAAQTWDSSFHPDSQNLQSRSHDAAPAIAVEEDLPDADALPTFVRDAQRAALWQSGWVRALLGVAALALTALLGLQMTVHERDRIAAFEPRTVPWLQELCRPMECSLSALQQIESIVVDASSFNKMRTPDARQDTYMLNVSLKNTAGMALALPHIELSLNDVQDQSIVRRVLKPSDLGASAASIAAGAEFSGGVAVQVDGTQLGGARIAGYRVLAFYP